MQVRKLLMVASAAILVSSATFGQSAMDTSYQVRYFSNVVSSLPVPVGVTNGTTDTVINVTDTGANIGTTFAVNAGGPVYSNSNGPCSPYNPCTTSGAPTSAIGTGNLCINAYVFSPNEELQACCTCFATPNGLYSWDVSADFLSQALDGFAIPGGVVKLVATLAPYTNTATAPACDATMAGQPSNTFNPLTGKFNSATNSVLSPGMLAWARGQVSATSVGTETAFSPATLTSGNGTFTVTTSTTGLVANGGASELARMTGQCAALISGIGICKGCRTGGL